MLQELSRLLAKIRGAGFVRDAPPARPMTSVST